MEESNFDNGMYCLSYRFFTERTGKGTWQVCTHVHSDDAKRFGDPRALLFWLEPDRWPEYTNIVTEPDFEYIRTKRWICRNHMGELFFRYYRR